MSAGRFSFKRAAMEYRRHFTAHWQQFLHRNFDSKEHVAMEFGVDGSTAAKWWDGLHAPSGFAVGYAYARWPGSAARCLGGQWK